MKVIVGSVRVLKDGSATLVVTIGREDVGAVASKYGQEASIVFEPVTESLPLGPRAGVEAAIAHLQNALAMLGEDAPAGETEYASGANPYAPQMGGLPLTNPKGEE